MRAHFFITFQICVMCFCAVVAERATESSTRYTSTRGCIQLERLVGDGRTTFRWTLKQIVSYSRCKKVCMLKQLSM